MGWMTEELGFVSRWDKSSFSPPQLPDWLLNSQIPIQWVLGALSLG
jgi:hypothetical protein